jgi:hypothetical protein
LFRVAFSPVFGGLAGLKGLSCNSGTGGGGTDFLAGIGMSSP